MTSTASLEGVKKVVYFPFRGKGWGIKLLVGSALNLANFIIPIVPLVPIYGYAGQIAKRVILQDEDPEMPEWADWGLFFSDGIKLLGASALYSLPGILTLVAGYMTMFAGNFAFMFDPRFYTAPETMGPEFVLGGMAAMFGGMLVIMIGFLLLAVAGLFMPPALGHLIAKGEFGAAFRVKEWWPILKANFSGFLLALVLQYGISMALIWVAYAFYFTVVLCFLMPFALVVAAFLINVIHLSLIAVTYRDGVRKLAEM
ncbi:MAG: DUF4013 domain-containing protein [Chloroflexota bacterium]